jgi:TatD DNase family protein
MTPPLPGTVDFHCHLDLYRDHLGVIRECDESRVATFAVTTTPKAFTRNVDSAFGSMYVMVGLGLHPQLVAERSDELPLFEKLLERTRYVGEIGLDASPRFYASFPEQRRIFDRILRACSEQGGKVLSIHSVRSVTWVLRALEENLQNPSCIPVLHWFTGTRSEAHRALEQGCYFSVNVEMMKNEKAHPLIRFIPPDRLLTESDGPFVELGERPIRPSDMPETLRVLGEIRKTDLAVLSEQVLGTFSTIQSASPLIREGIQRSLFKKI